MLQKLNTSLEEANAEKVAAQQSLHELELKMREMKARRLSPRESRGPENASVLKKILTMEDKSQGQHPLRHDPSSMLALRRASKLCSYLPEGSAFQDGPLLLSSTLVPLSVFIICDSGCKTTCLVIAAMAAVFGSHFCSQKSRDSPYCRCPKAEGRFRHAARAAGVYQPGQYCKYQ